LTIRKHHITLNDFPIESGKISFNVLQKVAAMFQTVAGGSLRLVMEGISSKKGPKPKWLEKSIDFQLTGLEKGSTHLVVKAPLLNKTLVQPQIPLFGRSPESLQQYTGIDLALESFRQAFRETNNDDLLDKHLLREMEEYRSLFSGTKKVIEITGYVSEKPVKISAQSFDNIKELEEQTPPPSRARVTGILDLMQYSKDLIQIQTKQGAIRAILSGDITFGEISTFFGKKVTLEGIANFKPSAKISAIEVEKVRLATKKDDWFTQEPSPIKEQLDFNELRAKQQYKGTKLDEVIGQWPGDESIEELLEMLNK